MRKILSIALSLGLGLFFVAVAGASERLTVYDVFASSFERGNTPGNTVDDDFDTRWSAEGEGEWIAFRIDAEMHEFRMAVYQGNKRKAFFTLYTAGQPKDRGTWRRVDDIVTNGRTLDFQRFVVSPVYAKYVVLEGHGNEDSAWNSVTEVAMYGRTTSPYNELVTCVAPMVPLSVHHSGPAPVGHVGVVEFPRRVHTLHVGVSGAYAYDSVLELCALWQGERSLRRVALFRTTYGMGGTSVSLRRGQEVNHCQVAMASVFTVHVLKSQTSNCTGEAILVNGGFDGNLR